ncbi:unnamed protein product [Caenorhabditis bovis]|uniref:VWFA domain-containing protein n=1 Tax=Caenorhabditis bovis TaxID=2654633 RepID=A0A8S1EG42_9PELO|nr:unnamed protein product [Caenorhabditis bovis]
MFGISGSRVQDASARVLLELTSPLRECRNNVEMMNKILSVADEVVRRVAAVNRNPIPTTTQLINHCVAQCKTLGVKPEDDWGLDLNPDDVGFLLKHLISRGHFASDKNLIFHYLALSRVLEFGDKFLSVVLAECYVTPCTRDVIIMVDGSLSMKNTDYINQEISFVNKLIDGWTLANDKVRVAVVGAYFANEFQSSPYLTTRKDALNRLERYRVSATQYGLYDGTFSTCVSFLESVYMGQKALYGPRENIQKRIIIFTAHNDPVDVASTKDSLQRFADNGFAVTIVGIGSLQPVYSLTKYHRFVNLSLANMASGNQAIINDIIDNGVCFLSPGFTTPKPEICTTSTTQKPTTTTSAKRDGTTRKPVRPTHPPQIVGDYQNCSCHLDTLYLDIVFVVDNSKAMTDMGLVLVKAEIATIVGQMNIDPSTKQHSEIGLITYNAEAEIVFEPTHFTDVDDFNEALYEDPRLEHVSNNVEVNLVVGLEKAADMLGNMRRGVHKAVIIYASAYKDDGDATHIADQIKESGYDIITIAYVEPDESILVEKIGELASPRMNLTSYRDDLLVDEIEDALCQVNCYCPNQWTQLIIDGRRFSECFFEVQIDANWISSRYACEALSKLNHTGCEQ